MTPPSVQSQTTSPASIIEGIEQGNALELQLIRRMRDGLDVIADGMEKECYNRSDACDELREGLEAMGLDITASRKPDLKKLIEDGIRKCNNIQEAEHTKRTKALKTSNNQWRGDAADFARILEQLQARKASLDKTNSILENFQKLGSPSPAVKELCNKLVEDHDMNVKLYNEDAVVMKKMHERLRAIYIMGRETAKQTHGSALLITSEFKQLCESIAQTLESRGMV